MGSQTAPEAALWGYLQKNHSALGAFNEALQAYPKSSSKSPFSFNVEGGESLSLDGVQMGVVLVYLNRHLIDIDTYLQSYARIGKDYLNTDKYQEKITEYESLAEVFLQLQTMIQTNWKHSHPGRPRVVSARFLFASCLILFAIAVMAGFFLVATMLSHGGAAFAVPAFIKTVVTITPLKAEIFAGILASASLVGAVASGKIALDRNKGSNAFRELEVALNIKHRDDMQGYQQFLAKELAHREQPYRQLNDCWSRLACQVSDVNGKLRTLQELADRDSARYINIDFKLQPSASSLVMFRCHIEAFKKDVDARLKSLRSIQSAEATTSYRQIRAMPPRSATTDGHDSSGIVPSSIIGWVANTIGGWWKPPPASKPDQSTVAVAKRYPCFDTMLAEAISTLEAVICSIKKAESLSRQARPEGFKQFVASLAPEQTTLVADPYADADEFLSCGEDEDEDDADNDSGSTVCQQLCSLQSRKEIEGLGCNMMVQANELPEGWLGDDIDCRLGFSNAQPLLFVLLNCSQWAAALTVLKMIQSQKTEQILSWKGCSLLEAMDASPAGQDHPGDRNPQEFAVHQIVEQICGR